VVAEADGVLDLVTTAQRQVRTSYKISLFEGYSHGSAGTAVGVVVMGTLSLVESLLGAGLAVVGLQTTSETVAGVSEALLDLLLGGLGGVGSDLLLGLCTAVLVNRNNGCMYGVHINILVEKSLRPASDILNGWIK
jgi:hypothetical protein